MKTRDIDCIEKCKNFLSAMLNGIDSVTSITYVFNI